jgi:hypothetical protein
MASTALSRGVGKVVEYPALSDMSADQRREPPLAKAMASQ